jgi:hypothetical protein
MAVSMTQDEFDTLDIALRCRRPDPLACYERLNSHEQSEAEPCLRCPIASWNAALVFSGTWANDGASLEEVEPNTLERIAKATPSIQEPTLRVKAA